jgi:hypothetical protein
VHVDRDLARDHPRKENCHLATFVLLGLIPVQCLLSNSTDLQLLQPFAHWRLIPAQIQRTIGRWRWIPGLNNATSTGRDLSFSNILLFQPEVQEHLYDPLKAFDTRSLSPWGSTESSRMPEFVLLGLFGPSADS